MSDFIINSDYEKIQLDWSSDYFFKLMKSYNKKDLATYYLGEEKEDISLLEIEYILTEFLNDILSACVIKNNKNNEKRKLEYKDYIPEVFFLEDMRQNSPAKTIHIRIKGHEDINNNEILSSNNLISFDNIKSLILRSELNQNTNDVDVTDLYRGGLSVDAFFRLSLFLIEAYGNVFVKINKE